MKLLIDLQGAQTASRYRGIGRHTRALVASLIQAAQAHDISVLLNGDIKEGFEELRYELLRQLPPENIKVFGLPGQVREMEPNNIWRMRAAELWRETFIANLQPDVLYLSSLFEGVVDDAVTSIGLMNAPHATAVTLFDLIPLGDSEAYLGADFMRRFYYRRAQSLKRADQLIAISEFAKREAIDLLQIPAERIDVALLAADPSFKRHHLADAETVTLRAKYGLPESFIFYVGAIEPRKNIPLIIEAFGKLSPEQRGDIALVFGGRLSDNERAQLKMAAARFGVEPSRLVLPGYIAEIDLAPLYSISRLFVFPSMQEGFGLPPLEAMACGTPTLVARNSSLPEVVGRDDQMFGTFDAADLAGKMARIFADPDYARELRDWGIERAAQFSWDQTGRRTLDALETLHERHRTSGSSSVVFRARPRLAFVSPLPSDRTGIANYASELLRELGCHYEIECVIDQSLVSDPWIIANFPLRNIEYFRKNADQYDYIVYQFGNSEFHQHMLDLVVSNPGVVILHDFFLSGLLDWLGNVGRRPKEHFLQQLYLTHGMEALEIVASEGRQAAAERYPANHIVFDNAHGIIVHSQWSIDRARAIYGDTISQRMLRIPHLRSVTPPEDKLEARRALGIDPDAFILSTFGFVAETKFGDRLIRAWTRSMASRAPGAALVFVGDHPPGPWGEMFMRMLDDAPEDVSISVTGYVDHAKYGLYLAASDVAVQLRQTTRGETSGAVLDCLGAGLPLVLNAHGTSAEINADAAIMLADAFSDAELVEAIDGLYRDPERRKALGDAGRREILEHHHPAVVGTAVRDAIERFTDRTASGRQKRLVGAIGALYAPASPSEEDLICLSRTIATSHGRIGPNCIFYDITLLTQSDAHTGIERVVRAFLSQMLKRAPDGYRIEPVRWSDGQLLYARHYLAQKFEIPADALPDAPIDYQAGDIYLTLEWAADILPTMADYLQTFRNFGGRTVVGIYDLLPLQLPHRFPDFIPAVAQRWFETVLSVADDVMCISKSVADDVRDFGNALMKGRMKPVRVNHFNLGSDISGSIPTAGIREQDEGLLTLLGNEKTFIMVGTIEPRKGHQQVIDAFQILWKTGFDANLVIVGRQGWLVDETIRSITKSREADSKLHWIRGASDEYLERIYRSATALIAASEGEGYGLPLVEGAARGVPLIARDLRVFREVAGDGAFYFEAASGADLAAAITRWIALNDAGEAPTPERIRTLSWDQSVDQFFKTLFGEDRYADIAIQ